MALPTGSVAVALLAAVSLLCVITVALVFGFVGHSLGEDVGRLGKHVRDLTQRVADLEVENDYLFDEKDEAGAGADAVGGRRSANLQDPGGIAALQKDSRPLPDLCRMTPELGPCGAKEQRWFYDEVFLDCKKFLWGGCRGNENNFLTMRQCRAACQVDLNKPVVTTPLTTSPTSSTTPSSSSRIDFGSSSGSGSDPGFDPGTTCRLPPDSGPCDRRLTRYFHAPSGQCLKFEYGGCAGNRNNFFTLRECRSKCSGSGSFGSSSVPEIVEQIDLAGQQDPCRLQPDKGPCSRDEKRFHFDSRTGRCRPFSYGGCGGNQNNFLKLSKCENRCLHR